MGLSAGQQCPQQFFIPNFARERVNFGATRRTGPAHDWPPTRSGFDQLRHAIVASSLLAGPAFRRAFWARGDANGTFG